MKLDLLQTSFVGGEFAPTLFGRTDIAQYNNACAIVENFLIRPFGPLISTPGTEFVNACKTGGSTSIVRLINFIFSRTDAYVIEMGVGYFRFYTDGAVIVSNGSIPYEVSHTYTASEIPDIQYCQLNDVIFISHANHPTAKLTRLSATNWTLTDLDVIGGPFQPDNTTSITIQASTATSGATVSLTVLPTSATVFIPSGSTTGHIGAYFKIGATVTNSTTGLAEQGYVRITNVVNGYSATGTVMSLLSTTGATTVWAEGSWSGYRGYPARSTFYQQRLFLARTATEPQNVWGSKSFVFNNFAVDGGADDDAINIQLASNESNDIKWLLGGRDLIVGTFGGEFKIGTGDGSALTPANTNVSKQTSWGSESVIPKTVGRFTYYIQRFGKKLRELFFDFETVDGYRSVDRTILSPHISGNNVSDKFIDIAYQQNPDTVLWLVCTNGTLATMTREVDQEVQGWTRQTTDGYYTSITTIPSRNENHDEVWVIVKRTINGTDVNYVERFKSQEIPIRKDQCFYVHSGLTYSSYDLTTDGIDNYSALNSVVLLLPFDNNFNDSSNASNVITNSNVGFSNVISKFGYSAHFNPGIDSFAVLALHCDGSNGGTTFTDSASGGKTVTANGNANTSTAQYKFGTASGAFDGTGDYLSVPNSADWDFGTGNFTIDFWLRPTAMATDAGIIGAGTTTGNGWAIAGGSSTQLNFYSTDGTVGATSAVDSVSLNAWNHYAVVRNGDSVQWYVNGAASGRAVSFSGKTCNSQGSGIVIGRYLVSTNNNYYNGYIDELRISKGIARWTSDFNVPNIAYNTSAYLTTADSSNWTFGTGDFTIDFWFNPNSTNTAQRICGQTNGGDNWRVYISSTGALGFNTSGYPSGGAGNLDSTTGVVTSGWNHYAIVRNVNNWYVFKNGIPQTLVTTPASGVNYTDLSSLLYIGWNGTGTEYLNGYLDSFRITKGLALWTEAFDPPIITSVLNISFSATSGTSVLATTSAAFFSSSDVGQRIRAIDSSGATVGELEITGYTSSSSVIGNVSYTFSSLVISGGLWGLSVSQISGLSHLENKTVTVLGDGGIDYPNKVVSNGSINLEYNYFTINVGLPYTQTILTLPKEFETQTGTSQGKKQRINRLAFKVNRSHAGFYVSGTSGTLQQVLFRQPQVLMGTPPSLYSGIIENITISDDYRYGSNVLIKNVDPLPIELLNIISTVESFER